MNAYRHCLIVAFLVAVATTAGIIVVTRLPAQTSSPAVPCTDSDGGANLSTKGVTTGIHAMDGAWYNAIYGTEPDPGLPKKITDKNYSTFYDYCSGLDQLVEAECNADDKIASYGHSCPYGCSDGACKSAPADVPPSITLSVTATSPTTWRPGGRGYYSMTVTDDTSLKTVVVTTSQMMYSSSTNQVWQCEGKTSCEEKVYIIVPSNPGAQFVTVTATDSAGQVTVKTVNFDAPACTADADCGSGGIQWGGASYCGSPDYTSDTSIMQYGVAATCKSGGICDTSSLPRVKQQCSAGQMCTFDTNGNNLCIAQPLACTVGAQITSVCVCGKSAFNYPGDWRVRSPTYCCTTSNGSLDIMGGPCPAPVSPPAASLPTCPKGPPNPYASCACGGFTYNTSNSYCCIDNTTGKEYQSSTACPTTAPTQTTSPAGIAPTTLTTVPTPMGTPATLPSPIPVSVPGTSQTLPSPIAAPVTHLASPTRLSATKIRRELQLLKSRGKQTRVKIESIEKNIASLEKKIDAKLRLLDRVKKEAVQKRVSAQIDKWQTQVDVLEKQKEKLEAILDDLRESFEKLKAEEVK